MTRKSLAALCAVLALFAAGCGSDSESGSTSREGSNEGSEATPTVAEMAEVDVTVTKENTDLSLSSIEAEPTVFNLTNDTKTQYHLLFARINDGVEAEEVLKNIQSEKVLELITVAGSAADAADPGGTTSVTVQFPEGTYLALDPEAPYPPAQFEVTPAEEPFVEEPASDHEITIGDFYFEIPDNIAPGTSMVKLVNEGVQSHEMTIGFKEGGKEKEGPFAMAPAPGGASWVEMEFKKAEYTALCYFPDPKSGKPHVKLGMKQKFTVE